MLTIKTLRLLHLISYLLITSQVLFYLIVYSDALKLVSIDHFLEQRRLVEQLIGGRYRLLYYLCLGLSILVVLVAIRYGNYVLLITASIALLCLALDISIALKGNIPINELIRSHGQEISTPLWEEVRAQWLMYFKYRGALAATGMFALLTGLIIEIRESKVL